MQKKIRILSLLDNVLADALVKRFDLIKIDVQGAELEVLKGGTNTLKGAQAVLMEVSFLGIYKNAPLLSEVISFMEGRGFVVYDICTLMRRPYDKALFQSDILFLRADSLVRAETRWI